MRKYSQGATAAFSAAAMLVLILDAKTALAGAVTGVEMCIQTVIPSLFPFFLLSSVLTSAMIGRSLPGFRWLGKCLRIPAGAECIYLIGLLGGYPVGAQTLAIACRNRQLSLSDGRRMLAFCSNPGPAFLFGIGSMLFANVGLCWLVWGIVILSSGIVALLTPGDPQPCHIRPGTQNAGFSQALRTSLITLATVCGWIILVRVILAFADRWFLWLLDTNGQVLAYGLLEISNGCIALKQIPSQELRLIFYTAFLSFGGLCITLQTYSVLSGCGVDMLYYLPGKIVQSAISIFLCCLVTGKLHIWVVLIPVLLCVFYRIWTKKSKISSRNPHRVVV